ncbi:MAG: hypothetical protein MJE12_12725, partial [Alphaproteobacteria bacterium]|nr:hypothetical protein [Alphaproteobacteria bacterium]
MSKLRRSWQFSIGGVMLILAALTAGAAPALADVGHGGAVKSIAVTPDGRRAVTAGFDYSVIVWDLTKRSVLNRLIGHDAGVNSVAVLPGGQHAVSGSDDGTVILWKFDPPTLLHRFEGHKGKVAA